MKKSILTALLLISFTLTGCGGPSASEKYNAAYKEFSVLQNEILSQGIYKARHNGQPITIKEAIKIFENDLAIMKEAAKNDKELSRRLINDEIHINNNLRYFRKSM